MKNKKFWISLVAGIMAGIMILSLILSLLPQKASAAQSSSEIKAQIEEKEKENEAMEERINALKQQQSDNRSDIKEMVAQKNLIDEQIGLLYAQVDNMNDQIAAYNVLIADKQEELEEAEIRLEELNEKYKERIRAMEEGGDLSYWSVLFEANSFSDLLDRLNMVQEIAASDSRRLEELREAAAEVDAAREVLIEERAELDAAKEELAVKQEELESSSAESQQLLNDLAARAEEYEALMLEYEDELEALEIAIGQLESDYDEAVYQEYLATMTTAPPPTTAPTVSSNNGGGSNSAEIYAGATGGTSVVDESGIKWVVPCNYSKVSSAFGWRVHPVYGDWRHHNGVDLNASCKMRSDGTTDSPIYASRAGVVIISKWNNSAGWYVTIDHLDGYRSTYMHMCCKPFVEVGDVVVAGQIIGCIGTTGTSTGDHLHFGVYKDGVAVNPMEYIG